MVYLFLANGFEETEALVTVDVLRRAGYPVTTVGIGGSFIEGTHGITVKADKTDSEVSPDESLIAVILPGGMPGEWQASHRRSPGPMVYGGRWALCTGALR